MNQENMQTEKAPLTKVLIFLDPRGRASRLEYWAVSIAFLSVLFLLPETVAGVFIQAAVFSRLLIIGIRRLHDLNKTGWHLLVPFAMFLIHGVDSRTHLALYGFLLVPRVVLTLWSLVVALELAFVRGTSGDNRFGAESTASRWRLRKSQPVTQIGTRWERGICARCERLIQDDEPGFAYCCERVCRECATILGKMEGKELQQVPRRTPYQV